MPRRVAPVWPGAGAAVLAAMLLLAGCSAPPASVPPPAAPSRPATRPPVPVVTVPPAPPPERPASYPPLPPLVTQRINGVDYTEARAFFARYGLKSTPLQAGRKLRLQDAANVIELAADQRDVLVNGLIVFLGEPVVLRTSALFISKIDAERLFAPLVQPGRFLAAAPAVRTIVLDPGHGGADPGAQNVALKVNEKTCTLDVVLRLKPLLEARGYTVVLTRATDRELAPDKQADLALRADLARRAGADLFISIHFNAGPGAALVHGAETYLMTPQGQSSTQPENDKKMLPTPYPGNRTDAWNAVLAFALQRAVTAQAGATDRGLKHARFQVLRELAACPGVLIEGGFLSNDAEAHKIATPAYRQKLAQAVADGVTAYAALLTAAKKP